VTLSEDERRLLERIAQSPAPSAMSDYFVLLNSVDPDAVEGNPSRDAWVERQITWYGVSVQLAEKNLVHVAVPANGTYPDLVCVTDAGLSALVADG
jgi:hypothetical protein